MLKFKAVSNFDTLFQDVPNRAEVPKLPRFNSIDRFLVEDAIMNVINSKNLTKKECAESLLRISGRSSMPLNYMLVEVCRIYYIRCIMHSSSNFNIRDLLLVKFHDNCMKKKRFNPHKPV